MLDLIYLSTVLYIIFFFISEVYISCWGSSSSEGLCIYKNQEVERSLLEITEIAFDSTQARPARIFSNLNFFPSQFFKVTPLATVGFAPLMIIEQALISTEAASSGILSASALSVEKIVSFNPTSHPMKTPELSPSYTQPTQEISKCIPTLIETPFSTLSLPVVTSIPTLNKYSYV